tara:strand:+ start:22 stop:1392 length:1371 start_codon:yes stop_codon:yes gene_type:complete
MKTKLSVSRCCCDSPIIYNREGRAWNSELDLTFGNIHEINTTFSSDTIFEVDGATDAYDYTSDTEIDVGIIPIPYNLQIERQTSGFKQIITGISSTSPQKVGSLNEQRFIVNCASLEPYTGAAFPWYRGRYAQQGQFPYISPLSVEYDLSWEMTIKVKQYSGNQRYPQPSSTWAYANSELRINNTVFRWYDSGWASGFPNPKTTGVWYAYTRNNVEIKLTSGGADISATFPATITLNSTARQSTGSFFSIDGQLIDQDIAYAQYDSMVGRAPMIATNQTPLHTTSSSQSAITTPDQIIEIEKVEFKIENGLILFAGLISWTVNNSVWSETSGVIIADNSDIATPPTGNQEVRNRFASASVSLVNDNWYVIRFKSLEMPFPSPSQPDLNTSYNPQCMVNNEIISYSEASGFSPSNRETDALFFKTKTSGNTEIKFFGFTSKKFQLSGITLEKVDLIP